MIVKVSKHIKDLLLLHDCVTIPGFGGFIGATQGAVIDASAKQILPPGKKVSFNRQLQSNDGVLIQHLANQYNISYHDAELSVVHFVKNSIAVLAQGGEVLFPEVGTVSANNEGNWVFLRNMAMVSDISTFGLMPTSYSQTYGMPHKQPAKVAALAGSNSTKSRSNSYAWQVAASVMVIALLGVLMATNVYIKPLALNNLGIVDFSLLRTSDEATLSELSPELAPVETTQVTTPLPALIDADVTLVSDQQLNEGYYMVWGSFTKLKNAEKMVRHLKDEPLQIMQSAEGYYRVVYFATDNSLWANNSLQHHRHKKFRQNIWLLYNLH